MFILRYVTTVADAFLPGPALRPLHQECGGEGPRDVHLRGQERGGQVPRCRLPPGQHWPAAHDIQVSIRHQIWVLIVVAKHYRRSTEYRPGLAAMLTWQ